MFARTLMCDYFATKYILNQFVRIVFFISNYANLVGEILSESSLLIGYD
jgi:hypothetical protein